ncbi:MAG: bifunctional diaminohydroxyphosphoribosylaminopyrimidine deaminase/5-amino-6-(5-phosphoribosylamino)uracil reductase RibD [Candidatus Aminicenantales bacterium]|jgi:diaminohydroxyphosphoribosylaminopyrimidine deaminase/5-amino-6-(5-phosphoribosylamino)uracil reductase
MTDRRDRAYMEMALGLAAKSAGRTSPNPCVGAVLVKDGIIVGWGHHEAAGQPHAEVVALARAGRNAEGATLYVTLEPCVHWGRTPPCADAVAAAGVKRVVAADHDPNPLVRTKGAARLRAAGIEFEHGVLADRNLRLNRHYMHFIGGRLPFVTLKAAVSLDGKMVPPAGAGRWLTSEETRAYSHLLRAEHDAVLVGAGTVLADDPRLSVRHPNWPGKKIIRVVLDGHLRTPADARLLADRNGGPVLIFSGPAAPMEKRAALEKAGAEVIVLPLKKGALDLDEALRLLGQRDVTGVLVEGGERIMKSAIRPPRFHRLVLMIAPLVVGGADAISFYGGGAQTGPRALRLRRMVRFLIGPDTIVEGEI